MVETILVDWRKKPVKGSVSRTPCWLIHVVTRAVHGAIAAVKAAVRTVSLVCVSQAARHVGD